MHAYANLRKPPNLSLSKIQIEALQVLCPQTKREKERGREEACNNYRQRRRFMACTLLPFPRSLSSSLLTLRVRSTRSLKFFGGTLHVGHTHSQGGALHICLAFDLIYTQISFFPPLSFIFFRIFV